MSENTLELSDLAIRKPRPSRLFPLIATQIGEILRELQANDIRT